MLPRVSTCEAMLRRSVLVSDGLRMELVGGIARTQSPSFWRRRSSATFRLAGSIFLKL
jgi:hypothetical protein